MRLLVTGAAGMLGRDVVAAAEAAGHDVIALSRRDLDLTHPSLVRSAVQSARPDSVVNCAGWTDVDGAEDAEEQATRVNGSGAGAVAAAAASAGAHTVHVSSDYVFDGTATEPYTEDDPTGPRSAYGRSKLAGERAVAEASPQAAIVRSSWLFGVHGPNFVATMLRLAREHDEVKVVDDQVGCPTYTGHLGTALVEIAERRLTGVLHVAGGGFCSWCELARATFEQSAGDCRAVPVSTAEFPRPAQRPAWSVLASTRSDAPTLPPWSEGLEAYLTAAAVVR
ncbi:MAG: dTDP-4-dehydrorhamnose reductase [Solirubrobacteraceae bacterium]